jgi:glycosyltransferase involved in cell wall biosynthesis
VLILAGQEGLTAARLHGLVEELKISDCVIFAGAVSDMAGLFSTADFAVLCSPSEGLPNGILEAMAAGLPVTGSDIPGIREAVGPEGWALLAPAGNPQVLADRILRLLSDPLLREESGKRNKLRIQQEFSTQLMFERSLEVIDRTL